MDIHHTEGEEVDIADENGNIKHISLNVALLKKYQNPYKILYLWSVQENLEVVALTECIQKRDELEEKRKKMMRRIKMTAADLNAMKPSNTGTVKELFSEDGNESKQKATVEHDYEAQKDVIHYV